MIGLAEIEGVLRWYGLSEELAESLLLCTMTAYMNGADTMAKKTSKRSVSTTNAASSETPAQTFRRLATSRTNKAIKSILLVGQLSGSSYESTDVECRAIVLGMQAALDQVKDCFEGKVKVSDSFKLPS